jgi:hypothetical protein
LAPPPPCNDGFATHPDGNDNDTPSIILPSVVTNLPINNPEVAASPAEDHPSTDCVWGEIEGVVDLNNEGCCHMTTFYIILKQAMAKKDVLSLLFLKKKYDTIT